MHALVDPGVAEIVQHVGLVRRELERLLHVGFGARPLLDPLQADPAAEIDRPVLLVGLLDPQDRHVIGGNRVLVALLAAQKVGQREGGVDTIGLLGRHLPQAMRRLVEMALLRFERRGAQPRLPVERRAPADLAERRDSLVVLAELLVDAGDHQPGEVEVGLQLDGELLEDQGEIGPLVALVGSQNAADIEHDLGDAGGRRRRLGHRRIGGQQPVHDDGVAVLLGVGLEQRLRIGALAEPAQSVRHGDGDAQARRIELGSAPILRLGCGAVARKLVDLRPNDERRRLGAIAFLRLKPGEDLAGGGEVLLARLQPDDDEIAQRAELVLRADPGELLLRLPVFAALHLVDRQHEIGEAVTGLGGQHLGREPHRRVEVAGIHVKTERGVNQHRVVRRLDKRTIELLRADVVIVIGLGHARGEITPRDGACLGRKRPRRQRERRPPLGGRLVRLSMGRQGQREQQGRGKQREGFGSHACHILG